MNQPQPAAECTTCHGYDSSTCLTCRGTSTQPDAPLDLNAIQARYDTYAVLHEQSRGAAFMTCPSQESAADVPALLNRVRQLEAELATAKAAGYRQAADNIAEMITIHGTDFDPQMIHHFLQNGAELREQFAAQQQTTT
ncbi:hypothetical protein ACWD4P_12745 [Kitasatospora sp. NPDC002543]